MGLDLKTGFKEREDEQICLKTWHSPSRLLYGKALAEVLSMSYIGEGDPSGTINVYDCKRGQIIYKKIGRTDKSESPNHSNSTHQNENDGVGLSLTGPYRAISMDGCAVIEFTHDDGCHAEIMLDIDDPSTKYDDTITKKLNCMCHDCPIAMVTYAILSNAVEAFLEVKLLQRLDDTFYGRIVAQSYLGEVVLFESNNENTFSSSCQKPTIIPLSRSVLAVPLGSSLQIEVDLRNHSNGKIIKGFMKCQADLNSDHVFCLDGENGQVELKIAWSD